MVVSVEVLAISCTDRNTVRE